MCVSPAPLICSILWGKFYLIALLLKGSWLPNLEETSPNPQRCSWVFLQAELSFSPEIALVVLQDCSQSLQVCPTFAINSQFNTGVILLSHSLFLISGECYNVSYYSIAIKVPPHLKYLNVMYSIFKWGVNCPSNSVLDIYSHPHNCRTIS